MNGGFGSQILQHANEKDFAGKIKNFGYPNAFIPHGSSNDLYDYVGLGMVDIEKIILENV